MVPEVFNAYGIVWVRDRQVEITVDAINDYLHTISVEECENEKGMPVNVVNNYDSGDLSASLRRDGSNAWGHGEDSLNHGDLHPDMAFWTVFIKCSLIPSRHRTNVSVETAQLLVAIQNNHLFDVGRIIFHQILDNGCDRRSLLYFPCLITHFCRVAGIDAASDNDALLAPQSDICKKAYNHFCTHHGLPNLPSERRYRNRRRGGAAPQPDVHQHGGGIGGAVPQPHHDDAPQDNPPPWGVELIHQVTEVRQRLDRVLDYRHSGMTYQRRSRHDAPGPSSSRQPGEEDSD